MQGALSFRGGRFPRFWSYFLRKVDTVEATPIDISFSVSESMQHTNVAEVMTSFFHVITSCVLPFPDDSTGLHALVHRGSFPQNIRACIKTLCDILTE